MESEMAKENIRRDITDQELRDWTGSLLSMALSKIGSMEDAWDLTQEAMLVLFSYRAQGKNVENPKNFLYTVLNRKYYDLLRKKYQLPTVTISSGDDELPVCEEDFVHSLIRQEDAERIRREVTFLAESYRTIMARHYFHNVSIKALSLELRLPEGTIKSRLDFGRKQLKKGLEIMENYMENSYIPHRLTLCNSGMCGLGEEPLSLTEEDLLAQNLLILAYDRPVTIPELSRAIGVSSAYVEPVINKLVKGELMKRMGDGKVYTDFILYQAEDHVKYLDDKKNFTKAYSQFYCSAVKTAIDELKETSFYSLRLERYMLINIADSGLYRCLSGLRSPQIFPDRPNGGRWIAFGTIDLPSGHGASEDQPDQRYLEYHKYALSGQRCTALDGYLGSGTIRLYNYESSLYPAVKFGGYSDKFNTFVETETHMLKLFYLIRHGISPETVDCDPRILEAIPLLEEQGYLAAGSGKPRLLIPCLTPSEERVFWGICEKAADAFAGQIREPMADYVAVHRVKIPAHLKSVPEQKQTMPYEPDSMMFVFAAIEQGIHPRELGYICPETIAVME